MTAAAPYSERKGISYSAWRELGVPAGVLEQGRHHAHGPEGRRPEPAAGARRSGGEGAGRDEQRAQQRQAVGRAQQRVRARSGCGIRPTTLRPAEQMPAMSSTDPLGLST